MSWRQRQLELAQLNRRISRWFGLVVGTLLGAFIGWLIALKSGHKDASLLMN